MPTMVQAVKLFFGFLGITFDRKKLIKAGIHYHIMEWADKIVVKNVL